MNERKTITLRIPIEFVDKMDKRKKETCFSSLNAYIFNLIKLDIKRKILK